MATKSTKAKDETPTYGLVANGSSQNWDIAVDETLSGTQKWFAQFDGPIGYLYFQLRSPKIIDELLSFITGHLSADVGALTPNHSHEIEISRFNGTVVTFIWDEEGDGRCFLHLSGKSEFRVRLKISRSELAEMSRALRQVKDDLCEQGLLYPPG